MIWTMLGDKMDIEIRDGTIIVEIIKRKIFNRGFVGNFVPHWCRYKNKVYLVKGGIDYAYMHGMPNEMYIDLES